MRRNALLTVLLAVLGFAFCWPPSGTNGLGPAYGGWNRGSSVETGSFRGASFATSGEPAGAAAHPVNESIAGARRSIAQGYALLPLSFEPNAGQSQGEVRFLARGPGYTLFLTGEEAVLSLKKPGSIAPPSKMANFAGARNSKNGRVAKNPRAKTENSVLRVSLLNSNPHVHLTGMAELPGKVNYFIGNDPKKWRTNLPTYGKVEYKSVYPGVDMVYYGNQSGQLEYDFIVAPGADASPIALRVQGRGPSPLHLAANGDLMIHLDGGDVRLQKPVVYQKAVGSAQPTPISGSYALSAANQVRFAIGAYDHAKPLYIDPILTYSTYLGGSNLDQATGIAVVTDPNNTATCPPTSDQITNPTITTCPTIMDVYLTGYTYSSDFPISPSAYNTSNGAIPAGATNAFVTKLVFNGANQPPTIMVAYSTFIGGSLTVYGDYSYGIAVDSTVSDPYYGSAVITGNTWSSDFPTLNPLPSSPTAQESQGSYASSVGTAFVTALNASGSGLLYSTYLGGTTGNGDSGNAIALDATADAYLTGWTGSSDFPTTPGAAKSTLEGAYSNATPYNNAFVTKLHFTSTALTLAYSTYLGGSNSEYGTGIALDLTRAAYVTGPAQSADLLTSMGPTSSGSALQTRLNGPQNAFVAKFDPNAKLVYLTYLGGTGTDQGNAIAVDANGDAYVTGYTQSSDFPTFGNAYQTSLGGNQNAFVTVLNSQGTAPLLYSTYLGGNSEDVGNGIAVISDASCVADSCSVFDVFVAGYTGSSNFPLSQNMSLPDGTAFQPVFSGNPFNAFAAEIYPSASTAASSLVFSTLLGGSQSDVATGVALDIYRNVYLTGFTSSTNFPTSKNLNNNNVTSYQTSLGVNALGVNASQNAFVSVLQSAAFASLNPNGSTIDFGALNYGSTFAPAVVTLQNTGNLPMSISNVAVAKYGQTDYSSDFHLSSAPTGATCGAGTVLPIAQSCSVTVTFTPSTVGIEETAQVVFDDGSSNGTVTGGIVLPTQFIPLQGAAIATPSVTVNGGTFVYNGNPESATADAYLGSTSISSSGMFLFNYTGTGSTPPTNVGTYSVTATFTSSNLRYTNATGTASITITPATPTVLVTGGTFAYNASPEAATATATGVRYANISSSGIFAFMYTGTGSTTYGPTHTAPTNVGTYSVTATFTSSDPDYTNATGTATITIVPAGSTTLTATGGTFVYNGNRESATANAFVGSTNISSSGTFAFTYTGTGSTTYGPTSTPPTNVGTYSVTATFTSSNSGYSNATGTTTITITPVTPTVNVTGGTFKYNGSPEAATATATGLGGANISSSGTFTFTYKGTGSTTYGPTSTPPTNVGTYSVTATFTSSNSDYTNATGTGSITITPATPTVKVTGGTFTYNGSPEAATATATGVGWANISSSGTFTFKYTGTGSTTSTSTPPTDVGTYSVTATFTSSNSDYTNATGTGSITITPATPTVKVTGGTFKYNGSPEAATATATGVGGANISSSGTFTFKYTGTSSTTYGPTSTPPTNVGTYSVTATFTSSNPDYTNATGTASITITLAALVPVPAMTITKTASASTVSPSTAVTYTYVVTNTGNVNLTNITVKDDNGTPNNPNDDFVVGTIASLAPGTSATLTYKTVPSKTSLKCTLGAAGSSGYALLSLGGDSWHPNSGISCNSGTVNGHVGISGYGNFSNASTCTANGNFYKGVNVTYSGSGTLKGTTTTQDTTMNSLRTEALNAASYFARLTSTPWVQRQFPSNGSINSNLTVIGKPGINVVNLTGLTLNGNLNLTGPAGTQFVLNISGNFNLRSGNITVGGGVGTFDVIYNITNPNASVQALAPTKCVGVLLAPQNEISDLDCGQFYGQVIGGYNQRITVKSNCKLTCPTSPKPTVTNTATASTVYSGVKLSATATATVTIQ